MNHGNLILKWLGHVNVTSSLIIARFRLCHAILNSGQVTLMLLHFNSGFVMLMSSYLFAVLSRDSCIIFNSLSHANLMSCSRRLSHANVKSR